MAPAGSGNSTYPFWLRTRLMSPVTKPPLQADPCATTGSQPAVQFIEILRILTVMQRTATRGLNFSREVRHEVI